jgi:hypothetical protein
MWSTLLNKKTFDLKETDPVAVDAVDLIVRPVSEVCGVELVFALDAEEALLVVRAALGNLLLCLEDHAVASELLNKHLQFNFFVHTFVNQHFHDCEMFRRISDCQQSL